MTIDPAITTGNGFHIERVPTPFASGFTRWGSARTRTALARRP